MKTKNVCHSRMLKAGIQKNKMKKNGCPITVLGHDILYYSRLVSAPSFYPLIKIQGGRRILSAMTTLMVILKCIQDLLFVILELSCWVSMYQQHWIPSKPVLESFYRGDMTEWA